MGFVGRLSLVAYGVLANTVLAIIWVRGGTLVMDVAKDVTGGTGPFTSSIGMMETVMPVLISLMYIILFGYLIYGGVQEERARGVRRPPR